jgi:hypothetical protein
MTRAAVIALAILGAGCSNTQRIADASGVIRANAESSKTRFERIEVATLERNFGSIGAEAQEGAKEQSAIIAATERIVEALPGIRDVTPWWGTAIVYGLVALSIIGIIAILWITGAGAFVRTLLASLTGMIPRRQRREADMAVAVMDDAREETIREYIAVRRASDPLFDEAYRRAARERRQPVTDPESPATIEGP